MVAVKTMKELVKNYETDLKKFLKYKTGIFEEDTLKDYLQEFYVWLIENNALDRYDPKFHAEEKDEHGNVYTYKAVPFETYIFNLMCWMLPVIQKRTNRHKHTTMPKKMRIKYGLDDPTKRPTHQAKLDYSLITHVDVVNKEQIQRSDVDIYSYVHMDNALFKINRVYEASVYDNEDDPTISSYVEEFKMYIRRTESHKVAEQMITFLDRKFAGCKGIEIAGMLKVSSPMINYIKDNLRKKYYKWQKVTV